MEVVSAVEPIWSRWQTRKAPRSATGFLQAQALAAHEAMRKPLVLGPSTRAANGQGLSIATHLPANRALSGNERRDKP